MAAIAAAIGVTSKTGDVVLSHKTIYGCTYSQFTNWLPRFGIKVKFIDMARLEQLEQALTPNVSVVYFETPVNPTLELLDISAICGVVNKKAQKNRKKAVVIVDNTFATPFCQRPLPLGVDMVVHSLTKDICGFGTDLGGAIITYKKYEQDLLLYRKDFGGVLSPKNAWAILVYGLPSLDLRLKKQQENAREIARFLQHHPKIEKVNYPGLDEFEQKELAMRQMVDFDGNFAPGSMLYFVLKSTSPRDALRKAEKFTDHIAKYAYTITLAVSLGQIRTLIETPSLMSHATIPPEQQLEAGIDPAGIRLSVGIENTNDVIRDLNDALSMI
jgi:cystathionine beta-lyase/cystathionine gamma-synthase